MTVEVVALHKPDPIECGCGCGKVGVARVKPWRDGVLCVKTGCKCPRCRGRRNKRKGQRGQAKASNALGMPHSAIRPGHEEFAGGTLRWEHKEGAQAGPVLTRFLASAEQSEASRSVGDHRPFVATFGHGGRQVVVFDVNDFYDVSAAFIEQHEKWSAS